MSEETVYANLKFQDSDKKENTQKSKRCGRKGKILSHGCNVRLWQWLQPYTSNTVIIQCKFLIKPFI